MERQIVRELSRTTNVFGLKLWTVITISAVAVIFVTIVVVFWLLSSSSSSQRSPKSSSSRKKLSSGTRDTPPSCFWYALTLLKRRSQQQAERESADDPLNCISVTVSTKIGVEKKENGKDEGMAGGGATMDAAAGAAKIIALATAFKLEDEHQEKKKHNNNNNGLSWTEMVSLGHRKVSGEDSMLQRQDELHRHVFLPAKQQQPQQNVAALQQVSAEGNCRLWVDEQTPRPQIQEQEQDSRRDGSGGGGGEDRLSYSGSGDSNPIQPPTDLGWGQSYSLQEIEIATNGFADETLLGEGGYGIVYRGELPDGTLVAVKNLLNNK